MIIYTSDWRAKTGVILGAHATGAVALAAWLGWMTLAGCEEGGSEASRISAASAADGGVLASTVAAHTTINGTCPVYPEEVVDPTTVVEWEGERIGLCCDECVYEWENWSDVARTGYVDQMTSQPTILANVDEDE